jgi:uncharacterized small protein (DUF1192 family)
MDDDRPRPQGDAASRLASESLDGYSLEELNERIQLCESEVVRVVAHRDKAKAHMVAADALFGPGAGTPATQKPDTRSPSISQDPSISQASAPPRPDTR